MLFQCPGWLWRRCKCIIPPAEELYDLVANVFHVYGPLKVLTNLGINSHYFSDNVSSIIVMCTQCGWLWQHCKCIIPPAEELYNLVANVFHVYGPLKDAQSFLPLFNSAAWSVAKNILELVQKGFLSDPPGVALYYQVGVDGKTGLPLYHCMRGTNMTEGGVHTHLRSRLPTSGVSPRHVQCCLLDFNLRHNLIVRS